MIDPEKRLVCSKCREFFGCLVGDATLDGLVVCVGCSRSLKPVAAPATAKPSPAEAAMVAAAKRTRSIVSPRVDGLDAFAALATATKQMCMDFVLQTGKRLGDATREQISAARDLYESTSKSDASKARWMGLIAQSLQPGQYVASRLTEERLVELRNEARRG